jgi:hypothetical protein
MPIESVSELIRCVGLGLVPALATRATIQIVQITQVRQARWHSSGHLVVIQEPLYRQRRVSLNLTHQRDTTDIQVN